MFLPSDHPMVLPSNHLKLEHDDMMRNDDKLSHVQMMRIHGTWGYPNISEKPQKNAVNPTISNLYWVRKLNTPSTKRHQLGIVYLQLGMILVLGSGHILLPAEKLGERNIFVTNSIKLISMAVKINISWIKGTLLRNCHWYHEASGMFG